jgi:ElaB/YqjD/DUF883 family membrane-anchored ribosome-binding protein
MTSNSPNITQVSFRTPGADDTNSIDTPEPASDERLSMLRSEIESLTQTISDLTARGTAAVENAASDGATSLRETIEHRPWMALGVSAAVGAVIAIAVVPKTRRGVRFGDASSYNTDDIAATVRRAVERRVDTQPLVSRFERMMDSISSIDPATLTASPAYETAKSWLQTLLANARKT